MTLTDYSKYYGSHSGPAELVFRFADSAEEAQALYDEEAVDLIWPLTDERMAELAENENWVPATILGTYTLLLNCGRDVFSDPLVRQALPSGPRPRESSNPRSSTGKGPCGNAWARP